MIQRPGIEFSICTYNRSAYLKKCVVSLLEQMIPGSTCITVIDNGSTDDTREWVIHMMGTHPFLRYIHEPMQGLSHARNTAWREAQLDWVFYLDDDCLPPDGFVNAAIELISGGSDFSALGGPIMPLHSVPAPEWLPEGFGRFTMPFDKLTQVDEGFLRGGCFMVKRSVLESLGGFNTSLGVKGNALGYGEEIELQLRMREAGFRIGYTPSLQIGHFIRTDKLNVGWILRSEFSRRRDKVLFDPLSLPTATLLLSRTLLGRIFWTPVHLFKALTSKSYSGKEAAYDILKPLAYSTGAWWGTLRRILKGN